MQEKEWKEKINELFPAGFYNIYRGIPLYRDILVKRHNGEIIIGELIEVNLRENGADILNIKLKNKKRVFIDMQNINNLELYNEEEDNKKEYWIPNNGEKYYFVASDGGVSISAYTDMSDIRKIDFLNCFKIKEEAERVAFEQLLHRKLKKFALENNEKEIDWNDSNQAKYYLFYLKGKFEYNYDYLGNRGIVYFTSKQVLGKAIETFKADLIRYFTSNK